MELIAHFKRLLKKFLPSSFILSFWHWPKAAVAALFYKFPGKKIILVGVAGTKGKTTTCHLISQILEEAGKKVAMISTALIKIGKKENLNEIKLTTPPPFFLQSFIKKALDHGSQYLILETSSHALIQHRTFGLPFKIVILTNMMPDHLDYHKTPENYARAHLKMIGKKTQFLILNGDDPNLDQFLKMPFSGKKIIYGLERGKDILAQDFSLGPEGSFFKVKTSKDSFEIHLPFLGKFNIYNALASISFALSQNINQENIKKALAKAFQIPGRMEKINCGQDFEVIVDYAHSPDSLKNLFEVISLKKEKNLIVVFGACGERDSRVRPLMGQIIDQNSDYIFITNDDPYWEDPEKIAKELISGIKNKKIGKNLWKVLERKEAIKKAIFLAQKNDIVLILGKGAEQWQIFKDKKIPWDDRKIAREILEQKIKNEIKSV